MDVAHPLPTVTHTRNTRTHIRKEGPHLLAFARGRRHFWAWVSEFRFEEDSVLVEGPACSDSVGLTAA